MRSSSRRLSKRRSASGPIPQAPAIDPEVEHPGEATGVRRREERGRTFRLQFVLQRELEAELGPFGRQALLDLVELFD